MKKIIIILGLLLFVPGFLSADTYYNWEQVQVDTLPEPTKDIMNKVYIKDDKYYVVKEVLGEVTPLQIGDSMNGRTFYNAIPDNLMEQDVWKNLSNCSDYYYCGGPVIASDGNPFGFYINYTKGEFKLSYKEKGYYSLIYINVNNVITLNKFNSVYNYDLVFTERYSVNMFSGHPELYEFIDYIFDHISTTPLENTYEWLEVDKSDVLPVVENKIYVPSANLSCYRFIDRNTLRGYFTKPIVGDKVNFYDFYLDQHYNSVTGNETLNEDITCLTNITTNYLYRNDIVEILIFFMIVGFFVFYIPVKILFRLFRRFS